ncbi:helix-turn-helix domain-containing protein [Roseateles sp. GG27B]
METNLQDVSAHWVALHESLGVGAPLTTEAQYEQALAFVEWVFSDVAADPAHLLGGLVDLMADRIRDYEDRMHPWPNTSTPVTILASLMQEHGIKQTELPEVGSPGVVSEVLTGKRVLNLRQVTAQAERFAVPIKVFAA